MAMLRCPHCNAPMTDEETGAGACPMCGGAVERKAAPAAQIEIPRPTDHSPGFLKSLLFAVFGTLLFCVLPVGIMFYQSLPERTEEKKPEQVEEKKAPEKKDARAELKKKVPVKVEPKKDEKQEEKKEEQKSLAVPEPKQPSEPKKAEEPKKEPEKKAEEKQPKKPPVVAKKEPAKPKPMPVAPLGKPRLATLPWFKDDAITIDGDLADWNGVPPLVLSALERGRATKKVVDVPRTINAYAAWCPKGILIAVDVVDTSGMLENAGKGGGMWPFWDNDAVELYLDTKNVRAAGRGSPHEHQFFALPFGAPGEAGTGGYESLILRKGGREQWSIIAFPEKTMPRAGRKTPRGWTMEWLIPATALREADLKPGRVLGFELQVDTGTNVFYHWANDDPRIRPSTHPSAWGEIMLGAPRD